MEADLASLVKEYPKAPEVDPGSALRNSTQYFTDNFVLPHYTHILRYARCFTGNVEDAKDLAQTTYERAWESFSRKPSTSFFPIAWLKTIVRNAYFNEYRRKKKSPITEDNGESPKEAVYHPDPFHGITAQDIATSDEKMNELEELMFGDEIQQVRKIPIHRRRTYYLFVVFDFDHNEITATEGIATGTVNSRVYRAVRNFRKVIHI